MSSGLGIQLWQKALPIDDQVEGACEMLGLDPLYVANEGIFLAIVARAQADQILAFLQQDERGCNASIIGEITNDHPKQVVITSAVGGRRVVHMLAGEQLPRIC
jgi:hydrogenase expression/formation protein HypE